MKIWPDFELFCIINGVNLGFRPPSQITLSLWIRLCRVQHVCIFICSVQQIHQTACVNILTWLIRVAE